MTRDYTELDKAILAKVADGPVTFTPIVAAVFHHTEPLVAVKSPAWRVVDRRLQALRKAGRIKYQRRFQRTPEGWVLCAE